MNIEWMGWTQTTALFFGFIALAILTMAVWEYFSPGGSPRYGILRFETTRGDRLFVSLLGSAFICLGFLGLSNLQLWWALPCCALFALVVFRYV